MLLIHFLRLPVSSPVRDHISSQNPPCTKVQKYKISRTLLIPASHHHTPPITPPSLIAVIPDVSSKGVRRHMTRLSLCLSRSTCKDSNQILPFRNSWNYLNKVCPEGKITNHFTTYAKIGKKKYMHTAHTIQTAKKLKRTTDAESKEFWYPRRYAHEFRVLEQVAIFSTCGTRCRAQQTSLHPAFFQDIHFWFRGTTFLLQAKEKKLQKNTPIPDDAVA